MLNLDTNLAEPYLKQVPPVAPVGAKYNVRFRKDLELAAVGDLEDAVTIGSGDDHLSRLDQISLIQRPKIASLDGNLASKRNQFCSAAGGVYSGWRAGCLPAHAQAGSNRYRGQRNEDTCVFTCV